MKHLPLFFFAYLFSIFPAFNQDSPIVLKISGAEASLGDTVCVDVTARNFTQIAAIQYGIEWNGDELRFIEVNNFGLPELRLTNFNVPGQGFNGENELLFAWSSLMPYDHPDEEVFFSLCFQIITDQEKNSIISFFNRSVPLEIVVESNNELSEFTNIVSIGGSLNLNRANTLGNNLTIDVDSLIIPACGQNDGLIRVRVEEGNAPYQFSWSSPGKVLADTNFLTGLSPGIYDLSLRDAIGNLAVARFQLSAQGENINPKINTNCLPTANGQIRLSASPSNPSSNNIQYRYSWNGGPFSTEKSFFANLTDTVYLSVQTQDGCVFTTDFFYLLEECPDVVIQEASLSMLDIAPAFVGDTISVPIQAQNLNNINFLGYYIDWDSTKLELLSYQLPEDLGGSEIKFRNGTFSYATGDLEITYNVADQDTILLLDFLAKNFADTAIISFREPIDAQSLNRNTFIRFSKKDAQIAYQVWPGDTDINGIVDHFDLFNVGLGFDQTGPARMQTDISWNPQSGLPWDNATPQSQINLRNADANGDGTINALDLEAIQQNWGLRVGDQSAMDGINLVEPRSSEGVDLFLVGDSLVQGSRVQIPIHLGTEANPVSGAFNLGFSIDYNAEQIEVGSVELDFSDSWLNTTQTSALSVFRENTEEYRIDLAISRGGAGEASGFGQIGVLSFDIKIAPTDGLTAALNLDIHSSRLTNQTEVVSEVAAQTFEAVTVLATSTQNILPANLLKVFPNPAQNTVQLRLGEETKSMKILLTNIDGKILKQFQSDSRQVEIPVQDLNPGLYLIKVQLDKGLIVKKLQIAR